MYGRTPDFVGWMRVAYAFYAPNGKPLRVLADVSRQAPFV